MVKAAQAQADHQDHRQPELSRQIGGVFVAVQRHAKTAHAFDDHDVRRRGKLRERLRNVAEIDGYARLLRRRYAARWAA